MQKRRALFCRIVVPFFVVAGLIVSASGYERWLYCSQNLWIDQNITDLEALFRRAAQAGYTHVLVFGEPGWADRPQCFYRTRVIP